MVKRAKTPIKRRTIKARERSVLEMTPKQARAFFLKPESYCSVDLPAYFQFGKLLTAVSKVLKSKPLSDMAKKPRQHEGVNYSLLSNKDGRHAWRPFQLIHPALYVSLVDQMTAPENWKFIRNRFKKCEALKQFVCLSIPVHSLSKRKDKAVQILQRFSKR